jgi:signal transduction histidine kinase
MKKTGNKTHATDIYREEHAFLEKARRTLNDPSLSQDTLRASYSALMTEYEVLLRKTIKMTMVGDTAQRKLRNANAYIKEQQQELEQKNVQLNQRIVERGKLIEDLEAFAHTVAHDLKNPLSIIIGYMDLVFETLEERHDTELMEMVELATRTAKRMHCIITELFTFASVREQEITPTILDMGLVVEEVETRLAHMLSEYQVELSKPTTWPAALGYAPWIEEVWINYINNALKYGGTPPLVQLGFDLVPSDPQDVDVDVDGPACMPQIRFWVRDNGDGLSPEAQAQLFTRFTRFDQARATGHGLGLSIVKRIVEKLGGQVGVESIPGQGSLFFFTLPPIEASPRECSVPQQP